MGATVLKKEIHEIIDEIEDKAFLSSMLDMLKGLRPVPAADAPKPINLLQHLDKFIEENDGLLKRLAQ